MDLSHLFSGNRVFVGAAPPLRIARGRTSIARLCASYSSSTAPECTQTHPEHQNATDCNRMHRDAPKRIATHPNHQNAPKRTHTPRHDQNAPKMHRNAAASIPTDEVCADREVQESPPKTGDCTECRFQESPPKSSDCADREVSGLPLKSAIYLLNPPATA